MTPSPDTADFIASLRFDAQGLIPAVVQHAGTGDVLMLGWMSREALEKTLQGPHVHFYSRSRGRLWRKGETSGNTLEAKEIRFDCDRDTLLVLAEPRGPVCHEGYPGCFYRRFDAKGETVIAKKVQP